MMAHSLPNKKHEKRIFFPSTNDPLYSIAKAYDYDRVYEMLYGKMYEYEQPLASMGQNLCWLRKQGRVFAKSTRQLYEYFLVFSSM